MRDIGLVGSFLYTFTECLGYIRFAGGLIALESKSKVATRPPTYVQRGAAGFRDALAAESEILRTTGDNITPRH